MSLSAMAAVWAAPITPTSLKLTALALADMQNVETGRINPSMATIAARVGVSRSQAQRLVHALIDAGILSVVENAAGGARGVTPRYQLHLDRLPVARTGSTDATGSVHATGSTDAADGSHGCTAGVAPMRRTGSTDATQTQGNPKRTQGKPKGEQRNAPTHRIPADWQPDETLLAWARQKRPDLDLPAVVEAFRDHYLAKGEARASWPASFRTWVNKERAAPAKPSRHSGFAGKNYREGIGDDGSFR